MIDFSRLTESAGSAELDPRDIFTALPHKPWPRLRLEQGEVLKQWHSRRDQRDLVIKQNTGGGKTVVGLLIAQSSLNEGKGPAVYLAPDTYLVAQVVREAERLGIPVTQEVRDPRFLSGKATLITTFQKLINGRSVFGVEGGSKPPQPLGTVVVDDAHAALSVAERQFAVSVRSDQESYDDLFSLFRESLSRQSVANVRAIEGGERSGAVSVPFWEWQRRLDNVRDLLDPIARDGSESWLFFSWPVLTQILEFCTATVTSETFEIKPQCTPIDMIPSFVGAQRRVYLTATLSDDSALVTELGADPEDVSHPVTPERAADLGDRLILAPRLMDAQLSDASMRELVKDIVEGNRDGLGPDPSKAVNAVVLVPSNARADQWSEVADRVCRVGELEEVVEDLKTGHVGLVVLVNKYDGVDLPEDACRLLVIDGVPTPTAPGEMREATALMDTETLTVRRVQRLEQGMGRGVRDARDHCAVLVLAPEDALTLEVPNELAHYSPATRAQIELGKKVAEQLADSGQAGLREVLGLFLDRADGWLKVSSAAITGVRYDSQGRVSPVAAARRKAYDLAVAGQPVDAARELDRSLGAIRGSREAAWYKEEVAQYEHAWDPDRAQRTLRAARSCNTAVLKPLAAPPVQRLGAAAEQALAASDFLEGRYSSAVQLQLGFSALTGSITFDEARIEESEEAFKELGMHLGFAAERPDKLYGTGPDVLWSLRDDLQLLLELKTGVTREDARIKKTELDQLAGHVNWHAANYKTTTSVPVLVHPSHRYKTDGTPPKGTMVLTPRGLDELVSRVNDFAVSASIDEAWRQPAKVKQLLQSHGLLGREAVLACCVSASPARRPRGATD